MKLSGIKSGAKIFIDSNIFIYHFCGISFECTSFLNRCEQGEITGVTSVTVLLEVLHRLMLVEAVNKKLIQPPNVLNKLKKSWQKVIQLNEYSVNTHKIIDIGIDVIPVSFETIFNSHKFRKRYGLMVNDSLILSSMEKENINFLATHDAAFRKIGEIIVYMPNDINKHE